jgi:hypothetical protein
LPLVTFLTIDQEHTHTHTQQTIAVSSVRSSADSRFFYTIAPLSSRRHHQP